MIETHGSFVVLIPGFPDGEDDTSCLPMQQQFMRALKKILHPIELVVFTFQYPFRKSVYHWHEIKVISFGGRNRGGLARLFLRKKVWRQLENIHTSRPVRGLLSFWLGECAGVGKKFGAAKSIRHYCWVMGQDAREGNKYPRRTGTCGDDLIALSDALASELLRNYGITVKHVLPPGIGITVTSGTRDIDLLAAGSLIPLKRFHLFAELVNEMRNQFPDISAVLIGEGPERKNIQLLLEKYDLEKNLRLAGHLPHEAVQKMMARAKVLIHPSSYEGFSGVCLEALSNGAQVISFVKPMNDDIMNWKIVNSMEEMVFETGKLLSDPDCQVSTFVYPSMEEVAKRIVDLFQQRG